MRNKKRKERTCTATSGGARKGARRAWKRVVRTVGKYASRKKRKETFNVHKEGKLGHVGSGSGGGLGKRTAGELAGHSGLWRVLEDGGCDTD